MLGATRWKRYPAPRTNCKMVHTSPQPSPKKGKKAAKAEKKGKKQPSKEDAQRPKPHQPWSKSLLERLYKDALASARENGGRIQWSVLQGLEHWEWVKTSSTLKNRFESYCQALPTTDNDAQSAKSATYLETAAPTSSTAPSTDGLPATRHEVRKLMTQLKADKQTAGKTPKPANVPNTGNRVVTESFMKELMSEFKTNLLEEIRAMVAKPQALCGACGEPVPDHLAIGCDHAECGRWYHVSCTGVEAFQDLTMEQLAETSFYCDEHCDDYSEPQPTPPGREENNSQEEPKTDG